MKKGALSSFFIYFFLKYALNISKASKTVSMILIKPPTFFLIDVDFSIKFSVMSFVESATSLEIFLIFSNVEDILPELSIIFFLESFKREETSSKSKFAFSKLRLVFSNTLVVFLTKLGSSAILSSISTLLFFKIESSFEKKDRTFINIMIKII